MAEKTILVIDDSPTILKVVQLVLTKAGYRVVTAPDGSAGIEAAKRSRPDLILLDFVMPKMNGYQVCRALSEDPELAEVPVVLMSAKGDQVGDRFVKVMGVVDYITKPFSPEAITAVVSHTIAKYAGASPAEETASAQDLERVERETEEAHRKKREALTLMRDGLARAMAAGLLSDPSLADRELDPAVLTEAARTALDDQTLEAILAQIKAACPELLGVGDAALAGDLRIVPIAEILGLLQDQEQTGILTVIQGTAKIELAFRQGKLLMATAAGVPDEFLLGRFIVENRLMDAEELEDFIEEHAGKGLLGMELVRAGKISREDLKEVMSQQTSELVYELLRWNFGRFTLRATEDLPALALEANLELTVDGILMEGFRRVDEWHLIEREIDDFDQVFVRNDDAVRAMGPDRLTREEQAILELVNGKNSVKDIIRQSRMSSFEVSKMLYRLLSIKLIRKKVSAVAV